MQFPLTWETLEKYYRFDHKYEMNKPTFSFLGPRENFSDGGIPRTSRLDNFLESLKFL